MKIYQIRIFFITACCAVFTIPLQAQDLIVTKEGDSINCKITKVKSDNIYFTFKHKEEIRNTLLPVSEIVYYQMKYYSTAEVPNDKIAGNEIYPHLRIAVTGGWSYRTARLSPEISSDFRNYANKLKSGLHYDLGLSYFFSEMLGFGLKYDEFLTSNEIGNVYLTHPEGGTEYGSMSDNIRTKFIGPSFCTRLFNSTKKNCLLIEIGIGYVDYRNSCSAVSYSAIIKGSTAGTYMSIGYDIGISDNFALGFQFSASSGILSQVTIKEGASTTTKKLDKGEYEDLSRINLSVGLRFNK